MNKRITLAFSLFALLALLGTSPLALAARPSAPAPGDASQQSGTIEFLDLQKGLIVINDREYLLSDKVTVNGKSGANYSLQKGMRVNFSGAPSKARPVISEVWTGQ